MDIFIENRITKKKERKNDNISVEIEAERGGIKVKKMWVLCT